jgi:hypothetical protein
VSELPKGAALEELIAELLDHRLTAIPCFPGSLTCFIEGRAVDDAKKVIRALQAELAEITAKEGPLDAELRAFAEELGKG